MAAFEAAVRLGYRHVETDVHATLDEALVAFHDPTLDRVTDRSGAIAELTWREVRRARMVADARVPLLEEVLGSWPELRVNIDVKDDRAVGPLLDVLRRTGSHHRVCVGAFSDRRMRHVRRALPPGTATALAPVEVAALRVGRGPLTRLLPTDVPCVQVPVRFGAVTVVDEAFVHRAHRQGRQVHVWTVNEGAEMERLLDMGVDAIVTDDAARLAGLLARRHFGGAA
jgi:glycerophosphoryl diester phosphodiesterase